MEDYTARDRKERMQKIGEIVAIICAVGFCALFITLILVLIRSMLGVTL